MRKSIYLSLLIIFLISSGNLYAQIVMERNIGSSGTYAQIKPLFDKEDYVLHSEDDSQKIYVKEAGSNSPYGNDDVNEDVTLSINLDFNPDEYFPQTIYVLDESGYMNFGWWEGANPVTITVPAGQYDIICHTLSYVGGGSGLNSFVIKEQVDIQGNMEMTISPSEADNYIQTNFVDEQGEDLIPGISENEDIIGGTATPGFDQHLFFNPLEMSVFDIYGSWIMNFEGALNIWNFYINDVSDRYSFVQSFVAAGYNGKFYGTKMPVINGFSDSLEFQNNPGDYVYTEEKFQPSIMGEAAGNYLNAMKTMSSWNGRILGGLQIQDTENEATPEDGVKAYVDNRIDEGPFQLLTAPSLADYVPGLGSSLLIAGNPVAIGENNEILYGSGASSISLGAQLNSIFGLPMVLPFNPQFTFTKNENPEIIQGNNAPLINIFAANYQLGTKKSEIYAQSIGRYGEVRENDLMEIDVDIKYNGESIYSGDVLGLSNFLFSWSTGGHADGVFDVTMSSENTEVDGLQGKSFTEIIYDWTKEDWTAPSVQRLQFRDTDGMVTDRFSSPEDGTLRLAAGDFEYDFMFGKFNYKEGNNIEFYYSKYDQNNWTELELTERPEYFFMPGFGDYYEASLESIQQVEDNIWYDVKIVCIDAAGNSQTQTVSPAFFIENANMAVNDLSKNKAVVYPNPFTEIVNIQLPQEIKGVYTLTVADMSGKIVYSETNESNAKNLVYNGSNLPSGTYVMKIKSEDFRIVEKLIKK